MERARTGRATRTHQVESPRAESTRSARSTSGLVVGAVDDPAEREADAIADGVLTLLRQPMSSPPATPRTSSARRVRRAHATQQGADAAVEEADPDGEIDRVPGDDSVADESVAPEIAGEVLDRVPATRIRRAAAAIDGVSGAGADGGPLESGVADRIQRSRRGGTTIDGAVQARIQPAFRTDLSGVRVHTDGEADRLNRAVNARAFTVGRDVFLAAGEYRPSSDPGLRLLAHELAHVEQQSTAPGSTARRAVVRRRFQPAVAVSKAHLRVRDQWDTFHGPAITPGTGLFIDDDPAGRVVQRRRVRKNVTWVPAVNVDPDQPRAAGADRVGYIRAQRAARVGASDRVARRRVRDILVAAEALIGNGQGKDQLNKPAHVDFLLAKAVRLDEWNPAVGPRPATFSAGLSSLQAKYDRIEEGAEHVATTLEHWRRWLFPDAPDLVDIVDVTFLESDLHEHGLGVLSVKFRKAMRGGQAMFADQLVVETIIKPEDKSLEKALLGSQPDSAVSQVNELAGLTGDKRLGTLNMEVANVAPPGATPVWTTLVERVRGTSSEDLVKQGRTQKGNGAIGTIPAFHETLVFAWLAGIDDLHWENVMWVNDVPYLIDADSVLMHDQMAKTGSGDSNQSGFSTFNKAESDASRAGIKALDPVQAKSKLLRVMTDDEEIREEIFDAIKAAISGHKGRTLPIYTQQWANIRNTYQGGDARLRNDLLNDFCKRSFIVGDTRPNGGMGPGLQGTTGINTDDDFYDQAAVRLQLERDMDAAVIPFFEYHYDTGHVTYNGVKIFHGLTVDQAFDALAGKFTAERS